MSEKRKPHLLIILDGWGHREAQDHNAIALANTPTWDNLWANEAHTLISGSGEDVGLPEGQMGNSEVGHMNLGAGRVVYQDFTRVNRSIADRTFFENPTLVQNVRKATASKSKVHIIGLLSGGGVHSHEDHISAAIDLALQEGATQIYVHAFLDGRDTAPKSAASSLTKIDKKLRDNKCGYIASICGRYYAMDRDQRWDRVEPAYQLMTQGKSEYTSENCLDALEQAYTRGESDEFVKATLIQDGESCATINENDSVIFMNFRADRARQLSRAFVEKDFEHFERKIKLKPNNFVTLTRYSESIPADCAFPPNGIKNDIGEYLSEQNKTQLRIAETEKYAHVTFFFSGGREQEYEGENRELIPSPNVATYDLQPEMSAYELTEKLCAAITSQQYDFIVCNYANGDMVGHTGNLEAAIKAAETLDGCLKTVKNCLEKSGGECLITADHGNLEQMLDTSTQQALTSHTCEPVPLIYLGRKAKLKKGGLLSDIAPTLLTLMGLPSPKEMTGKNLIEFE